MEVRRSSVARWNHSILVTIALFSLSASAQERGFRLHRFEGTTAGSTQFLVERPWYSNVRFVAVGLTVDGSNQPLTPRVATGRGEIAPIVSQALLGHLDLAGSLFERVLVTAGLPVTLLERGTPELLSGVGPLQTIGVGDPRVGVMVRVGGDAEHDAFSAHVGADVWIPIGAQATHQGDTAVRLLPRAVLAGAFGAGRWALEAGFLFRPYASYGPPQLGMTAASEVRAGLAIGASLLDDRFYVGPEALFSMQVVGANAFAVNGMSLELLGGVNYLIADFLQVGLAGGTAVFGAAGTPDARAMVRLAWAPKRTAQRGERVQAGVINASADADADGVPDLADRCPFEAETRNGVRDEDGCPEFDADKPITRVLARKSDAGVAPNHASPNVSVDAGVLTTSVSPVGALPTSALDAGTATIADADDDGIGDELDRCPATPEDFDGFEDEDGCPEPDNDQDGIADVNDRCADEAETLNGVDDEDGCPDVAKDADRDGVPDGIDRCPFEPENVDGVRDDDGCPEFEAPAHATLAKLLASVSTPPAPDAAIGPVQEPASSESADGDADGIPDDVDRCPVTAEDRDGFEDDDGCPELDNDDDGIPDARDRCPNDAEVRNGWKDDDGCPDEDADADGDSVSWDLDRCPLDPGAAPDGCPHEPLPSLAVAGFPGLAPAAAAPPAGASGAPPPVTHADFDGDGVADDADACPMSAEDTDGFEDEDGCPEPDNDHDGILDAADKCPLVAESINGNNDTDGCPDLGVGAVTIRGSAVVLNGIVRFKAGSANLERTSLPLLQQVASTLRAASSLSVEIQGHTDDVGNAATNIKLSKRRAEAIRTVLVRGGVAPTRLVATGYGPTRPRASNKTAAGREQNRRVEFLILGESK